MFFLNASKTNSNCTNDDTKYTKLVKNLEKNGIGVNKITESSKSIGLDLTQFIYSDILEKNLVTKKYKISPKLWRSHKARKKRNEKYSIAFILS